MAHIMEFPGGDRRQAERACTLLREAEGGVLTRQAYVSGFFNPGLGRRTAGTQGGKEGRGTRCINLK